MQISQIFTAATLFLAVSSGAALAQESFLTSKTCVRNVINDFLGAGADIKEDAQSLSGFNDNNPKQDIYEVTVNFKQAANNAEIVQVDSINHKFYTNLQPDVGFQEIYTSGFWAFKSYPPMSLDVMHQDGAFENVLIVKGDIGVSYPFDENVPDIDPKQVLNKIDTKLRNCLQIG